MLEEIQTTPRSSEGGKRSYISTLSDADDEDSLKKCIYCGKAKE